MSDILNVFVLIRGKNIQLRPMTFDDLHLKVQWYNDPDVRKTLILDEVLELEKTIQWFETAKNCDSRQDLTIETDSARPIGMISLVNIDLKQKTAEIVLVIGDKEYWGKGVMLEAESLLIQWAFDTMGIKKIWAQTISENIASLITMKKLGFEIDNTVKQEKMLQGQQKEIVHLNLLPENFKPLKK